ncbi:MAG: hypothetical protein IT324_00700 [Anaerolineae bacterium]|nr:hypothetical protein [Anaerolineae bacterium]
MSKIKLGFLLPLVLIAVACNIVPPTVVVQVVTSTPDPRVIQITVTSPAAAATSDQPASPVPTTASTVGAVAVGTQSATATPVVLATTAATPATATAVPATPTSSVFPTETRAQLLIVHQDFEHGYMVWISTQKVIWVLYKSAADPNKGEWQSYPDTFVDGEPELDANLTPPNDKLYQPRRGFGKLWRNTPEVKDRLGWGITPEFSLNTNYVYQPGGTVDADNKYIAAPGKHFITTLGRQTFALSEPTAPNTPGTWERVG